MFGFVIGIFRISVGQHQPLFGGKVRVCVGDEAGKRRTERPVTLAGHDRRMQFLRELEPSLMLGVNLQVPDAVTFVPLEQAHTKAPQLGCWPKYAPTFLSITPM